MGHHQCQQIYVLIGFRPFFVVVVAAVSSYQCLGASHVCLFFLNLIYSSIYCSIIQPFSRSLSQHPTSVQLIISSLIHSVTHDLSLSLCPHSPTHSSTFPSPASSNQSLTTVHSSMLPFIVICYIVECLVHQPLYNLMAYTLNS